MSKSLRGSVLGSLIVVVGWVLILIAMAIVGTLQISGTLEVSVAWWIVMVLLLPLMLIVGLIVHQAATRKARRRFDEEVTGVLNIVNATEEAK